MELKGKYVLIVGTGISGISAAQLASGAGGARVILFDGNEAVQPDAVRQ